MVTTCRARALGALLFVALAATSCAKNAVKAKSRLRIPAEMRGGAPGSVSPAAPPQTALRLTEGGRQYDLTLPSGPRVSETRVSLAGASVSPLLVGPSAAGADGGVASAEDLDAQKAISQISVLYAERRYEAALRLLEPLLEQRPEDARLWSMKGSVHARLGQRDEAREAWERAVELRPDPDVTQALRAMEGAP